MISKLNNTISEATESGIGSSVENVILNNSINTASDVDLYRFSLNKGQGITLDIDTVNTIDDSTNFDSYLRIFDASGKELTQNDDASAEFEASGLDSFLGFIANTTGKYYVGVSDAVNQKYDVLEGNNPSVVADNFVAGDYDLTLNITEVKPDADPDNTVSEAIALKIDKGDRNVVTVEGEIEQESDVDLHEIELGEAQGVILDIDAEVNDSKLDSYLRLFDAEGRELVKNDNSEAPDNLTTDSSIAFAPPTPGKYYVGVTSAGNFDYDVVNGDSNLNFSTNTGISIGNYQLKVQIEEIIMDKDSNNTISEAIDTGVGSTDSPSSVTKSDEIDSKFDVDIFKFKLQAAEGIKLDINASTLGSDLDSYLRIFDSEGNELGFDDNNDANFTGDFSSDSSLAFVPDTPGEYYVGVGTTGNFDYDPINGRTNFSDSDERANRFFTTGSYELVLNSVEVVEDDDPDNTIAEAIPGMATSSNSTDIAGEIDFANDVDLYRFTLESGQGISFDISTATQSNLDSYLRLFNSQGKELAFDNDDDNNIAEDSSFDSLLRFAASSPGEYFIGVSSEGNIGYDPIEGSDNFTPTTGLTTGSYSLAVDISTVVADTDSDNTIAEAVNTEVNLGEEPTTISQAIDSSTDVDLYQFQLNKGNTVSLDIDAAEINSELDSIIRLFNSDGKELTINDDASAPNENSDLDSYLKFTALTTGSYYVGVSSYDNFAYDSINGSNNFSNDVGTTTGDYNLVINITEINTIEGTAKGDRLNGTKQADLIDGLDGNDTISGAAQADQLIGGEGDDSIRGNDGNDSIRGGEGSDALIGGTGDDVLYGNGGADIFVLGRDGSIDTIADFEDGTDKIMLPNDLSFSDLTIDLTTGIASISTGDRVIGTIPDIEPEVITETDFIL